MAVRAGAGNTRAEAGGLGLFFCFVGWGFFRSPPNSLGLLLPSIMLHAFAAGKKRDVFTLKTAKRKRNFVNEINFKSRMFSLGVKSKKVALIPLFIFIF